MRGRPDDASPSGGADPFGSVHDEAMDLFKRRRFEPAFVLFKELCAGTHGQPGSATLRKTYAKALKCGSRMLNWAETEALARQAVAAFPQEADFHRYLGEALIHLDRAPEAVAALARAVELDPDQEAARGMLQVLKLQAKPTPPSRPLRIWPTRRTDFRDPRKLVSRFVLKDGGRQQFIQPSTTFMTLGSCFAGHLGRRLEAAGYTVNCEDIGEEINSPVANRHLFEWVEKGVVGPATGMMEEVYGPGRRERLRRAVEDSDVFVLTLGVAPSFFDPASGEFVFTTTGSMTGLDHLQRRCEMRTPSVAEVVESVGQVLDTVRRMARPGARMVLTVSPVPLSGTTEFDSAVIADCLSKSTLRLACQELVAARAGDGALYWPSFEIVRWLGAHFDKELPPVYGEEDGNSRHVSTWLVDLIIDLFLEHWSVPAGAGA
jgi:hypothetical protein